VSRSYSTNQWYGLPGGVSGSPTNSLGRTSKDNPEFLYPKKVRKNLGGGPDKTIQRGFIRSLLNEVPSLSEVLPNRRFFFQFNPERIMRSVSVSSGMMMPLLQDAQQFSVATPGNSTFSFDIFLNREAEINQNARVSSPPQSGNLSLDYIASNPQQFGVLSDLSVLDTIIGQGVSQDTVEALAKIQAISSTWEASDTTGGSVTAPSSIVTEDDARTALGKVFGNSAFLISTPIRIVFSSLFMVDGFITGSAVQFSKFSENLVPTMCAINLSVEAKYIGFARQQTYLTEALQSMVPNPNAGGAPKENVNSDPTEYNYLIELVKSLPNYQISLNGTDDSDHTNNWNTYNQEYYKILSHQTILSRCGFQGTPENAEIYKEFTNGTYAISVSHRPWMKVWRSYVNEGEKATAQSTGITRSYQSPGSGEGYGAASGVRKDVLLLDFSGVQAVITDAQGWKRLARYGGGGATEDKQYDNVINTVWANAKATNTSINNFTARNLYFDNAPPNFVTQQNAETRLYVEYGLELSVSLYSAKTASKPNTIYLDYRSKRLERAKYKAGFVVTIPDQQVR
jgi:hypothetical protein